MICRSCKSDRIGDILSLGDQYLSDFIEPTDPKPEQHPLNLVICKDCSLVQLRETTPSKSLYNDHYGYRSGINETMKQELNDIVMQAGKRVELKDGDIVVDIGANDGTLLTNYEGFTRIAFEPVTKFAKEIEKNKRAEIVINDFFNLASYRKETNKRAKIITAISMFYDLDDPNTFVADLAKILRFDGVLVIQQNYVGGMLEQMAVDNICHEHLEYYSLLSLEKLLNRHGLEVVDVQMTPINGGSFRTFIKHMDNVKKLRMIEKQLKLSSQFTYLLFGMKAKKVRKEIHDFIEGEVKKGKTVYVYGASTRGNTLLQYCGLDHSLIKAAVERNPEKYGKVYGGTEIPIISEEQARKDKPDYFLILPWFFRDEFIQREAEFVKNGGALIFPLPRLEVYRG